MPSRRAVFLKPPESVCPPRASRGPGRGIPVRILDSGEISWTSATGDAATGRFSPISFPCHTSEKSSANSNHSYTSKTASRKSFACHTSEIPPGGTLPFAPPRWFFASSLVTCYQIQVLCFQTILDSFAKTPGVGGGTGGCTSHSETPSGAPEPLVTCHISRSKILRDPVPARSNSLSLLSPFCGAWFFPANLRGKGPSRL